MKVIVIGGGAAGFFAAITCARENPAVRVTLLERSSRVLGKVKISGGGRCNVTHACFDPTALVGFYPRGGQALRGPFTRFQPRDTVAWFAARHVVLKTEADGRMFPVSDDSQTIIDCLMAEAKAAGVDLRLNAQIQTLRKSAAGGFDVTFAAGDTLSGARVILATGSGAAGWDWAQALGHSIEPPVPSLFTFTVKDPRLEGLAGISVPQAKIQIADTPLAQEGPLLITHWGFSGPAALKLSAWGARILHAQQYRTRLQIRWDAAHTSEQWLHALKQLRSDAPKKTVGAPAGPLRFPQRLWSRFLQAAGWAEATRWADISNEQCRILTEQIQNSVYAMDGKSTFKEEFVTCGGVRLDEVDFRTLESKRCPGLYFAGEVLDVDAVTGGFNFQNAWTTGWIAGTSAAR